jgi:hypothetical protein
MSRGFWTSPRRSCQYVPGRDEAEARLEMGRKIETLHTLCEEQANALRSALQSGSESVLKECVVGCIAKLEREGR